MSAAPAWDLAGMPMLVPESFLRSMRRGHFEPAAPDVMAAFEAWVEVGRQNEWFGDDGASEPLGPWVWDEPEAEFEARKAEWATGHAGPLRVRRSQ